MHHSFGSNHGNKFNHRVCCVCCNPANGSVDKCLILSIVGTNVTVALMSGGICVSGRNDSGTYDGGTKVAPPYITAPRLYTLCGWIVDQDQSPMEEDKIIWRGECQFHRPLFTGRFGESAKFTHLSLQIPLCRCQVYRSPFKDPSL